MSENNNFDKRFDSFYNSRRDYELYQGIVDETDNLPAGIYASIIRYEPTCPEEIEEIEEEESDLATPVESISNWWNDPNIPF
jgi:hypothetical protein